MNNMEICQRLEDSAYSLGQAFDLLVCLLEFCNEENPAEEDVSDKDFRCRVFAERLNTRMPILHCCMDIIRDESGRARQLSDAAQKAAQAEKAVG